VQLLDDETSTSLLIESIDESVDGELSEWITKN
jgi:hypothetical protein